MVTTPDGRGYWIVGQDGAVYSYGDATFLGSLVGYGLAAPVVAAAPSLWCCPDPEAVRPVAAGPFRNTGKTRMMVV